MDSRFRGNDDDYTFFSVSHRLCGEFFLLLQTLPHTSRATSMQSSSLRHC